MKIAVPKVSFHCPNEQIKYNPVTITAKDKDIVLDTSVLMDYLFQDRDRHQVAVELVEVIASDKRMVFIPAHFYFEFISATLCEHRVRQAPLALKNNKDISRVFPFETCIVSIDIKFVNESFLTLLTAKKFIDLKGGDMIYVTLALSQQITLISEDKKMLDVARKLGTKAMCIEEFLLSRSS